MAPVTTSQLVAWCQMVLAAIGAPVDDAHLVGPLAWCFAEGGWQHNDAMYNPWNTTQRLPGSRSVNAAGVQSYVSLAQGVAATVQTLENGRYGLVLAALDSGNAPALALAVGQSHWGTSGALLYQLIPRAAAYLGANPALGSPPASALLPAPPAGAGSPASLEASVGTLIIWLLIGGAGALAAVVVIALIARRQDLAA